MNARHEALAPQEIPLVAVDTMNRTHQEEVALVNALARLLQKAESEPPDVEALDRALQEWIEHTRAHFERENRWMEEYGFPAYPVHAQEHATVLEQLQAVASSWRQNRETGPLVEFVFELWPQWFLHHVNTMDTVTAQFLSPHLD